MSDKTTRDLLEKAFSLLLPMKEMKLAIPEELSVIDDIDAHLHSPAAPHDDRKVLLVTSTFWPLSHSQQRQVPKGPEEFGDPRREMTVDELQEFCIALSFNQDDYTEEVIRAVERRMLAQPLFVPVSPAAEALQAAAQPATPSATWRKTGEPDPHGNRYDCERAALAMGEMTDDELANGAFMNYDVRPPLQDIIDGKAYSPIAWMTAVKDRIRWLSRSLEKALAATPPKGESTTPAEPQEDPETWSREQWIAAAMRVYMVCGDSEDEARELATYHANEQDWFSDLEDPYEAALDDIEGRPTLPPSSQPEERKAVPSGWRLVPEEPTPAMLKAGDEKTWVLPAKDAWAAMLAAAPAQPAEPAPRIDLPRMRQFMAPWLPCDPSLQDQHDMLNCINALLSGQ